MLVKDLIDELKKVPQDLPVCIDDYMGFAEACERSVKVECKKYICFPYTEADEFNYVNLNSNKTDI